MQIRNSTLFLPFVPGFVLFFAIYGVAPLEVTSLTWLPGHSDPVQAWLGWSFFQHSPWTWPLGLNPRLGLELGNSIIFTDSNPLLALFFKAFSFLLPPFFQYFGLWILACLVLQSWFGWKLASLYAQNNAERFLGTCIFAMSLPMLFRMGRHFNLAGHFLILAALYLCLVKQYCANGKKACLWAFLLAAAAMIHSYIFVMAAILWAADLGDRNISNATSMQYALTELGCIMGLCAFACWQAGYFVIGRASSDGGFGMYRMNLWSIIDSDGISSYIIPNLPSFMGEDEGFAYLGMGGILLCACALLTAIVKKPHLKSIIVKKWPLLFAFVLLTLLALSNKTGLFVWEIHIPIPKHIENFLQFFRSSGRMFWPVYYAIIIFSLAAIFKYWPKRNAAILLAAVVLLQAVDVHALVASQLCSGKNETLAEMTDSIHNPFWTRAAKKYANIRGYPVRGKNLPKWNVFGYYALKNGMGTDIVYLSRYNTDKLASLEKSTLEQIKSGKLDPDSLYIVDGETFELAQKTDKNTLVKQIDGFNVLAPNWE